VEDSFRITAPGSLLTDGIFGSTNAFGNNSNGSAIFGWCSDGVFCSSTSVILLTNVDNNPFSLLSLDASNLHLGQVPGALEILGNYAAGGTVNTSINLSLDLWQTFAFDASWQGLSSVTISVATPGGWDPGIDNIVVSAIPIPAAVWLLGSALGCLGWLGRKPAA
jgi:hypothetical protein